MKQKGLAVVYDGTNDGPSTQHLALLSEMYLPFKEGEHSSIPMFITYLALVIFCVQVHAFAPRCVQYYRPVCKVGLTCPFSCTRKVNTVMCSLDEILKLMLYTAKSPGVLHIIIMDLGVRAHFDIDVKG